MSYNSVSNIVRQRLENVDIMNLNILIARSAYETADLIDSISDKNRK